MSGDGLKEILDIAKHELGGSVPPEVLSRIEKAIRDSFGTQRIYIAAHRKAQHLEALETASADQDSAKLSAILGVSVRRVQQLRKLKR